MSRAVPLILQNEIAECGLACLAMIAGAHGKRIDLPSLRQTFQPSSRGAAMKDLALAASRLGLTTRALKIGVGKIERLQLPAILHWELTHFVVLVGIRKDSFIIHDPAIGRRVLTIEDFSRSFTGIAQEYTPTANFSKKSSEKRVKLSWLFEKRLDLFKLVGLLAWLSAVMQLVLTAVPFGAKAIIDSYLSDQDEQALIYAALGGLFLLSLYVSLVWTRGATVLRLISLLDTEASAKLYAKLLGLPYDYFSKRDVGALLARFSNLSEIREALGRGLAETLVEGALAITFVLCIAMFLPVAVIVSAISLVLYAVFRWLTLEWHRDHIRTTYHAAGSQNGSLVETLQKILTVKANGIEILREQVWAARFVEYQNASIKEGRVELTKSLAAIVLQSLGYGATALFALAAAIDGRLTAGEAATVGLLQGLLLSRAYALTERLFDFGATRVHLDALGDVAHHPGEATLEDNLAMPGQVRIEFRDVGFRYSPTDPYVLKHVSFLIEDGEHVAITGPSGCGKSTVIALILGLYKPTEGQILINGQSLDSLSLVQWRRFVGTVMQGDHLFYGNVRENVSLFEAGAADDEIQRALEIAQMWQTIQALPMREYTMLSDAPLLSGGEIQRLLLARAVYKRPRLLLLDEASSNLDEGTEQRLNDAIAMLSCTRLVVAHRETTIRRSDRQIQLLPSPEGSTVLRQGSSDDFRVELTASAAQG